MAVISVVFTNYLKSEPLAGPAIAAQHDPTLATQLGEAGVAQGLEQAATAFGNTFLLAAVLCLLTLVSAYFLPRKREESHLLDDVETPPAPVIMH